MGPALFLFVPLQTLHTSHTHYHLRLFQLICQSNHSSPRNSPLYTMPSETSSSPSIAPLSNSNYPQWAMEMKAWLVTKGLWMLVSGKEKAPEPSKVAGLLNWKMRSLKAAGGLFLAVQQEQKINLTVM